MNKETRKLAVDIVLCRSTDKGLEFVAIERKFPPLGLALPGGFVDVGESVEAAAVREAKEELSMDVKLLEMLGVYSDPKRDPRKHVVSCAFLAYVAPDSPPLKAADDAKSAVWIPVNTFRKKTWCFDHRDILVKAFEDPEMLEGIIINRM
jgi:8-oxo-dGTP diphosphatase